MVLGVESIKGTGIKTFFISAIESSTFGLVRVVSVFSILLLRNPLPPLHRPPQAMRTSPWSG